MISVAAYSAYYQDKWRHLASLSPEQRVAYLAQKAEERRRQQAAHDEMALLARSLEIRREIERERREAQERLDREPEVVLARQCIAGEGLVGAVADRLLAFARDLARRRVA